RQHRVGRDPVADLGEDPDEVEVQAMPGRERPGHVDVVVGVGIRGVWIEGDETDSDAEGEQVQKDGNPHGRCSVAPAPGPSDRYEWATVAASLGPLRGGSPSLGWPGVQRRP